MIDQVRALLDGLPGWVPPAAAGALLLLVVVSTAAAVVRVRRGGGWLSGIGPQAVVALGGVAVSVHGLWGFARETAGLPPLLAGAFIAVFDAAELVLLVMLYRAADPTVGWTRELRLMHRTAWTLVGFSAAMNAVHAPNWWSRPVLAAIPALATWLIELQLRAKLHHVHQGAVSPDEEESGRPGPVRLVVLLWQHTWSAIFAALGLDTRASSGAIARAALAQRAALRVYRLRLALVADRGTRRHRRRVARYRRQAQRALDRADVATDPEQALAVVRRLAALTRADDVARLDLTDTAAVLALLESLAVTPAAARQSEEAARCRAEAARQEEKAARQRAEEATAAARKELDNLRQEAERAEREAATARQRAEAARHEEADARQRAEAARQLLDRVEADAQQARERLRDLNARAVATERDVARKDAVLSQLNAEVEEARLLRDRLQGDLGHFAASYPADTASGDPMWRSPAKQAGWEYYLSTLRSSGGQTEPSAAELAERFGVDAGNARNWLRDFRAARAAQLAARQPRAAQPINGHSVEAGAA